MTDRTDLDSLIGLPVTDPQIRRLAARGMVRVNGNELVMAPHEGGQVWADRFDLHRQHLGFQAHTWALTRELGFSCTCGGAYAEWRIGLSAFRDAALRHIRPRFEWEASAQTLHGRKKARQDATRALVKSKALLHQYLSRRQKWELRATDAFTVTAADGCIYRINKAVTNNVQLLEEGVPVKRMCVVAKGVALPVYDLMLAQKFMLETHPEDFMRLAVVTDTRQVNRMREHALAILRQAG